MVFVLELFSGTGSVGTVVKEMGWEVFSVDNDKYFDPSFLGDIKTWDFKNAGFVPDIIWASPPCTTFSRMQNFRPNVKVRATDGTALNEAAEEGDRLLNKALEIIYYFLNLNPKMVFLIENPSNGIMRHMPQMQDMIRTSTSMCHYGNEFCKPTDIFSNIALELETRCQRKHKRWCQQLHKRDAYAIPASLIEHVMMQTTYCSSDSWQPRTRPYCQTSLPPSSTRSSR